MPAAFSGTLKTNEFYNALFNAYRLITTFADGLDALDDSLANKFRSDGGMYQDKSVFTDMDVLMSRDWDPSDTNVLAPELTVAPAQQEIVVNKKRQIGLYSEAYLSRRAWLEPSVFDAFNSVVQAQVGNTKKLYEQRLVDVFVGTTVSSVGKQSVNVDVTTAVGSATGEEANRLEAQAIAKAYADVMVDVKDSTRDYNDYGFVKAYDEGDMEIVWNALYYNKILYTDLPTIYHKDNLLKSGRVLPAHYFGAPVTSSTTADGSTHRALQEYKIRVNSSGVYSASGTVLKNVFPGDLLPSGTPIVAPSTGVTTASWTTTYNGRSYTFTVYSTVHAYAVSANVIAKVIHKNGVRYLSSFETSTEFWNPKNLTTNRYLTWMFANPEYLKNYPFITLNKI
jgi:hypothetical protein